MLEVVNPANGQRIASFPEDTPESIAEKVIAARGAQAAWEATALSKRIEVVLGFRAQLVAERDTLAHLLTQETGKPITQAGREIDAALDRIDFFIESTPRVLASRTVYDDGETRERIDRRALGTVAVISAWNYPYFIGLNALIPALLTGNVVLYKPSELALQTGLRIARLLVAAGLPPGVLQVVVGTAAAGRQLVDQPVDGVFFTGSHATGVTVAKATAARLIHTQLELGGKDPAYVCEDVDISKVAEQLADGAFYNNGQSCCSVERIYIHHKIYQQFVDRFVDVVRNFVVGAPDLAATYIGPLARAGQRDVIEAQIAEAVAMGARVACGGNRLRGAGNYFAPTVLLDVSSQMQVMQEESFGPIVGIQSVRDDAEAVALMNDTRYGLTAAIYCTNGQRAQALLARVSSGSAYLNCCDRVSPRLPWSGVGDSGIGVTLSEHGVEAFTRLRAWHIRSS